MKVRVELEIEGNYDPIFLFLCRVYRMLEELKEQGSIKRFEFRQEKEGCSYC